jgi:hypothetical protein
MKPEFCFAAPAPAIQLDAERKTRTFSGVANSGAAISRGPFGRMAVDLEGARLLSKTPVLLDHDAAQRVGFAALRYAEGALHAEGTLLKNALASSLASDADDGFPWQMSIYADPESVEDVPAGKTVTLNGREEQGPMTVLRRPLIRELSFTPTGADHQTPVQVLSQSYQEPSQMANDNAQELADLKTKMEAMTSQLDSLTSELESERAAKAEALSALENDRLETRKRDVVSLFSSLGKTDVDPAPYLTMPTEAWEAVKKDLSAFSARDKDYLFHDTADNGTDAHKAKAALIDQMAAA